jgi:hypothetical protein
MRRICISMLAVCSATAFAQAAPTPAPAPNPTPVSPPPAAAKLAPAAAASEEEEEDEDDPERRQGTIVQLDRDVVYIDLGQTHGVRPGETLRVLRTITATHPVTGKKLIDHFPLGQMSVEQVSRVLSFGRLERRIFGVVKVGDVVRIEPPKLPLSLARSPEAKERAAAAPSDGGVRSLERREVPGAAGEELNRIFELTLGRVPRERAELLSGYLSTHPNTPFAVALRLEIEAFRRFAEVHQRALEAARSQAKLVDKDGEKVRAAEEQRRLQRQLDILASLPQRLEVGDPVDLAITMREPFSVQAAFAYVRRPDSNAYDRITLRRDGDGYFRGRLPAPVIAPPSFEIFLEAVGNDNLRMTAGTPVSPLQIHVDPRASGPRPAQRNKSELRSFFEYVDFNRFKRNDYYLVAEGDFTYRPGTWLAGISAGFGVMYGRGGKNEDLQLLQSGTDCGSMVTTEARSPCGQRAGFNYGYFETEFRFGKWVSMVPRIVVGQTVQGPGAGGELKLRIGQYTGTNLLLGVSYFKDFGALGSLQLEWNVIRGWPMAASVIVTNLPAQGDVGVRIVYQLAYRARSFLQPALRIGVAARNIEQIGMSVGLGLIAAW